MERPPALHAFYQQYAAAFAIEPVETLVWPNGADFDPETLHDWPDHRNDFVRMAAS